MTRPLPGWLAPAALFGVALLTRLWAAAQVDFPATEVSAYYVGVARNVVEGRGLVSEAVWSYATPPLVVPKPAFDLWLPLGSLVTLPVMAILGATLASAQLATGLLGAAVAPLTWLVAREAAIRNGLPSRRVGFVAVGSGLVAAALGPLLVAAAAPDSTTSFAVFALLACTLMPAALRGRDRRSVAAIALGICLGLAYLSRQEALYIGLAYLLLVVPALRAAPSSERRGLLGSLAATVTAGALTVAPWFLRNLLTFGSLTAGQAVEIALLTRNEEIFAFAERPSVGQFLAQGVSVIVGRQVEALGHNLIDVLLVPAAPVALVGLLGIVALRRTPALREPTALRALVLGGAIGYLVTSLVFPVASAWGTFLHAAGPALVALTIFSALALDAALVRVGRWRGWSRGNAWLAPLATLALVLPLAVLQVRLVAAQASHERDRFARLGAELSAAGLSGASPIVSDHPIWLAETLRRPGLALPDEPATDLWQLAQRFGAPLVLILDGRGRHPGELSASTCFEEMPGALSEARLFAVAPSCDR